MQTRFSFLPVIACIAFWGIAGCNEPATQKQSSNTKEPQAPALNVPVFNADSAYQSVAAQVAFGPRVPGSAAQQKCAAWMQAKLKENCDTVYRQETKVKGADGKILPCINLIGVINPKATKRILLLTHWDSRSWADMDTKDKDKPILAADDAGSGVGVLIELARAIRNNKLSPTLGIDILLTDVEDYGKSEWGDDSYCLGTQYWAQHPHVPGYTADFGILLDMVGAKNAQFPMEELSGQYAPQVQQDVWAAAGRAGFSSYFTYAKGAAITDDHEYVNKLTHIPTIDIINLSLTTASPFAAHWHTHQDNMSIIDKSTLKAVGQTLLQLIYETARPAS
jgi:hypothetical protein